MSTDPHQFAQIDAPAGEGSAARPTGHPEVDAVLEGLADAAALAPADRAGALAAAHERLHAALDEHRRVGS